MLGPFTLTRAPAGAKAEPAAAEPAGAEAEPSAGLGRIISKASSEKPLPELSSWRKPSFFRAGIVGAARSMRSSGPKSCCSDPSFAHVELERDRTIGEKL